MQAIILSAGLGTRLRPLTEKIPKVMLSFGGKSLLKRHIKQLKKYDIKEIFINLHYLPKKITEKFGDGSSFGIKINYHFEKKILGTAGALSSFSKYLDNYFILVYGDLLTNFNFQKLIEFDKKRKGIGTIVVHKTNHAQDSDLITLNKEKKVKQFFIRPHKKSLNQEPLAISGIYILSKKILDFIKPEKYSELDSQILPEILRRNLPLYGYFSSDYIQDIGTIERYNKVTSNFLSKSSKF